MNHASITSITATDAARQLGVTRQRIAQIARERHWMPLYAAAGSRPAVYRRADVTAYRPGKGGRPRKSPPPPKIRCTPNAPRVLLGA